MTQTELTPTAARLHLQQSTEACETLLALLDAEREAYKNRDLTALDDIIQQKTTTLTHIEAFARQRSLWIAAKTAAPQTPAESQEALWLSHLEALDDTLPEQWQTLRERMRQCQEQNLINGKLLARNQQVFSRLLALIRGQSTPDSTYAPKGNRQRNSGGVRLGEA